MVHAAAEVPLCGHATLASGWVVLNELSSSLDMVRFETKSGQLTVARADKGQLRMALPADRTTPFCAPDGYGKALGNALGVSAPTKFTSGVN